MISTHLCCTDCLVLEHSTVCLFWDRIHIVQFFPFNKIPWWPLKTEEVRMDLEMGSCHRQYLLFQLMSGGVFFGHILSFDVSSL